MAERDDQGQFVKTYRGGNIDGWSRGMDNKRQSADIPYDILRNAVNVDVLTSGKVRRRRGISQVVSDADAHSVFANGRELLWGTKTTLKACSVNFAKRTLLTSARLDLPLSYVHLNGVTYFSNEKINGKINADGVYEPWGIVPPTAAPTVVSADAGVLERIYQVTCTFVIKVAGVEVEESGAPLATSCAGGDAGVITVSAIPQPTDSRVTHVRLYISDVDGSVLYQYADVPVGITTRMVSRPFALGKKLSSQFMANMPPGQLIEYFNGRMYVAVDNLLIFSDALRYGAYHTAEGFYMFPERITLLKAADSGLFLSADSTYYLSSDTPTKATLVPKLPYKAIEGAACAVPYSKDILWLSERGVVRGSPDGSVTNITEGHIAMDRVTRACVGYLELNGSQHALAISDQSTPSPLQAKDYTAAEATRVKDFA